MAAVWGLLLARPQLFAQHMQGYAALMRDEAALAAAYLRYRLCLWVALVACAVMFLGFLGIALMMWGTTPNAALIHAWILSWCLPCLGGVCLDMACVAATATVSLVGCLTGSNCSRHGAARHPCQLSKTLARNSRRRDKKLPTGSRHIQSHRRKPTQPTPLTPRHPQAPTYWLGYS